jgi:hypothetical protein
LLLEHPGPHNTQGNHVMRLRVPPGRGGADLVKVLPGSHDRLYLRWHQMWEPGYDFTARNHGSGLHAGSRNLLGRSDIRPDGSDAFSSIIEPADGRMNLYTYYRGMYMDCANPNSACWGDYIPCWFDEGERICDKAEHRERLMLPPMESGRWYCFEMMLNAGTPVQADSLADGVLNYWIDGIEYGPWRHLWFRTTPNLRMGILWMSLFHHAEHSVEGILLDDIVVSTERVGCGPVQTTEPPAAKEAVSIAVFPYPGHGGVLLLRRTGNAIVTVTDVLGRIVHSASITMRQAPGCAVELSGRLTGVQLARVQFHDGTTASALIDHLSSRWNRPSEPRAPLLPRISRTPRSAPIDRSSEPRAHDPRGCRIGLPPCRSC